MKANFLTAGLSARRKTIDLVQGSVAYASSRIVLIVMMAVIVLTSCHDQPAKETRALTGTAARGHTTQRDTATWFNNRASGLYFSDPLFHNDFLQKRYPSVGPFVKNQLHPVDSINS